MQDAMHSNKPPVMLQGKKQLNSSGVSMCLITAITKGDQQKEVPLGIGLVATSMLSDTYI